MMNFFRPKKQESPQLAVHSPQAELVEVHAVDFNQNQPLFNTFKQLIEKNQSAHVLWHVAGQQHVFVVEPTLIATMPVGNQSRPLTLSFRAEWSNEMMDTTLVDAGTPKNAARQFGNYPAQGIVASTVEKAQAALGKIIANQQLQAQCSQVRPEASASSIMLGKRSR